MKLKEFIDSYREAFGPDAPLPIVFWYSDEPVARTPKTTHCVFREVIPAVRASHPASLNADNINCGGGRFYTGFAPLGKATPTFVSITEKYKQTPEMVVEHIARSEVPVADKRWLNLARIDIFAELTSGGHSSCPPDCHLSLAGEEFPAFEGVVFFATPDILAGLAAWAWFDNNDEGAVTTRFGSGCSTIITDPLRENQKGGRRTFIGCMDVSVRPLVARDELSFAIPASRFREMLGTMRRTSLLAAPAWKKVRARISG